MISFLKGDIVEINVDYVLIDVNGIGFQVFVGKPQDFTYGRSLIYTYYQVKEDGVSLFGFKTKQEQDLFLRLTKLMLPWLTYIPPVRRQKAIMRIYSPSLAVWLTP